MTMSPQWRSLIIPLARRAREAVWPALAKQYRANPSKVSGFRLKALGIADLSYRPNFAALANAIDHTLNLDGSVIECGVFRGSTLLGMAHRLALHGRGDVGLIGCDSFQGFPAPTEEDALEDGTFHERALQGVYSDTSCEALWARLCALGYAKNIKLVRGFFSDTLPSLGDLRFRLVHLDCDLYESYVTCLNFLYPRLVSGGYMVFDEYDLAAAAYPGAQKAIDHFLADKPEKLERRGDGPHTRCFIVKR